MSFSDQLYPHLENKTLPRLPVPTLEETLNKYLVTVEPLAKSPQEFEQSKRFVEDLRKNAGKTLQADLEDLAKHAETSWLEGFWDTGYLEFRVPVMVHVSPYYSIKPDLKRRNQALRCASLLNGTAKFFELIQNGKLPQDKERGKPIDNSQYGKLLASTRIPKPGRDDYFQTKDTRHAIIVCNNQFYSVDFRRENGDLIPEHEIVVHIQAIMKDARSRNIQFPVGAFTADDRDHWAQYRAELLKNNKESLEKIESGLLAICLDDESIDTLTELSRCLLHGNGRNRWFDKSIQLMIGTSGNAGILMEHTRFDGHTILRYCQHLYDNREADVLKEANIPPKLDRIDFVLSPQSQKDLTEALIRVDDLIDSVDSEVLEFKDFGKGLIKTLKCSPDAFVQMAYQLAYYRYRKEHGNAYESCNVKQFLRGRTSCIRPCHKEACEFTKIFDQEDISNETRVSALRKAIERQAQISREAKNGHDVDRHLLGLWWMARFRQQKFPNEPIPQLFSDPLYSKMKSDYMSTSNSSGQEALTMFGFGPTHPNGFGLGYVVAEDYINVGITSFSGEAPAFKSALQRSLQDLKDVLSS